MKKIAVFLLCFSLLSSNTITVCAAEPNTAPGEAMITTEVPESHHIRLMIKGFVDVTLDGQSGTDFTVERLSQPVLEFIPNGRRIIKLLLNGEDITDAVKNGLYTLAPVYGDMVLEIIAETEEIPSEQSGNDPGRGEAKRVEVGHPDKTPVAYNSAVGNGGGTDAAPSPGDALSTGGGKNPSGGTDAGGSPTPGGTNLTDGGANPTDGGGGTTPSPSGENPSTGIAGSVSIGTAALLLLGLFRKKRSDKEK